MPACNSFRFGNHWQDIALSAAFAAVATWASYQASQLIAIKLVNECTWDVWFDGDIPAVYTEMVTRWVAFRSDLHPLFSLIVAPWVYALEWSLDIEPLTAVRVVMAAVAGLWSSGLFFLLRLIGCRRFDATVLSLLAMTSAAAMFWFVVPERFPLGSLTILLAMIFVAFLEHGELSPLWYVLMSASTLSITGTNWMAGIVATAARFRWKQWTQITAYAFCLVAILWGVEKLMFRETRWFFPPSPTSVTPYINISGRRFALQMAKSFVFHSIVMPEIQGWVDTGGTPGGNPKPRIAIMMSVQSSGVGSGSAWATVSVILWAVLLGGGLWGLFSVNRQPQLRTALIVLLLGQLALHTKFGQRETFLFALHWVPLLIVLVAFGMRTSMRRVWLGLALIMLICTGINNGLKFKQATEILPAAVIMCRGSS